MRFLSLVDSAVSKLPKSSSGWMWAPVLQLTVWVLVVLPSFPISDLDLLIFFQILFWPQHIGEWGVFFALGENWGMNFSIPLIPVGLNVGLTGVTRLWLKSSHLCGKQRPITLGKFLRPNVEEKANWTTQKVKSLVISPSLLWLNLRGLYFCVFFCRVPCKLKLHLFIAVAVPRGRGHQVQCQSELPVQAPYPFLWAGTSPRRKGRWGGVRTGVCRVVIGWCDFEARWQCMSHMLVTLRGSPSSYWVSVGCWVLRWWTFFREFPAWVEGIQSYQCCERTAVRPRRTFLG